MLIIVPIFTNDNAKKLFDDFSKNNLSLNSIKSLELPQLLLQNYILQNRNFDKYIKYDIGIFKIDKIVSQRNFYCNKSILKLKCIKNIISSFNDESCYNNNKYIINNNEYIII